MFDLFCIILCIFDDSVDELVQFWHGHGSLFYHVFFCDLFCPLLFYHTIVKGVEMSFWCDMCTIEIKLLL